MPRNEEFGKWLQALVVGALYHVHDRHQFRLIRHMGSLYLPWSGVNTPRPKYPAHNEAQPHRRDDPVKDDGEDEFHPSTSHGGTGASGSMPVGLPSSSLRQ